MSDIEEGTVSAYFKVVRRFFGQNARWLNRAFVVVTLIVIGLRRWFPGSFAWIPQGLDVPLAVLFAGLLLDQVLQIGEELHNPPIQVHRTQTEAYDHLSRLVRERGFRNVDLIQFSGQTAIPFLQDLASAGRPVNVRILLMHPDEARVFDSDGKENQLARIDSTIGKLRVLSEGNSAFSCTPFFYRTPPGLSGIIVDNRIASVGWYRCFLDGKEPHPLRVRSHNAPTATALDHEPLAIMVRQQFDSLLRYAEPAAEWHMPVPGRAKSRPRSG